MKKIILVLMVTFIAVMSLSAGGNKDSDVRVLRFGDMSSETGNGADSAKEFVELVNKYSDGTLKVEYFPNSQLGSMQEHLEMVASGALAFFSNGWGTFTSMHDGCGVFDTPYLTKTPEDYLKIIDMESPIVQQFNEELIAANGIRIIGTSYTGGRCLTSTFPVYSPDDLKGVKIRSVPYPIYTAAVQGLGAIATPIEWADLPVSLVTGTVSGQETPVEMIYNSKFFETQKYLMETNHIMQGGALLVNERVFQSLTSEQQDAIMRAATESKVNENRRALEEVEYYTQKLEEEGMTVIGVDEGLKLDEFKKSTDVVVNAAFGEQYSKYYEQINEYLGY
ncbi:MAG: TRAP transporter substrate-binding protein [Spirochaetales bacterium]